MGGGVGLGGGVQVGRLGVGWGGGAQAPLTSPCPPSDHTITINPTLQRHWVALQPPSVTLRPPSVTAQPPSVTRQPPDRPTAAGSPSDDRRFLTTRRPGPVLGWLGPDLVHRVPHCALPPVCLQRRGTSRVLRWLPLPGGRAQLLHRWLCVGPPPPPPPRSLP